MKKLMARSAFAGPCGAQPPRPHAHPGSSPRGHRLSLRAHRAAAFITLHILFPQRMRASGSGSSAHTKTMPAPHPLNELLARVHSFIKHPPPLVFVFVLVVLLELEESVQRVPTIRLLENAICQKHYQDEHLPGPINESMCKTEHIQVRLAHIRGLLSFFDSLPSEELSTNRRCSPLFTTLALTVAYSHTTRLVIRQQR